MERNWQAIAPVDGVEKYARIQGYAASQKERGGGRKDSRKRQSQEDGFKKNTAGMAVGEVSEFHSCLIRQFLVKAREDNRKMKESIESMGVDRHASGGTKSFAELLALNLVAR